MKHDQSDGCKFCMDELFATRHILEDELLNSIMVHIVQMIGRGQLRPGPELTQLRELLDKFRDLDNETHQRLSAIHSLQVIEQALESNTDDTCIR